MSQKYHLCHLNIGNAKAPLFDPQMAGFLSKLEEINNLAYQSPGFVWHLIIDINNPEDLQMYGEPGVLFNLSVWESVDALFGFVYRSQHAEVLKSKRDWFGEMQGPSYALWWQPAGELPTLEEGKRRIAHLAEHGPTEHAFSFRSSYPSPDSEAAPEGGGIILLPIASQLEASQISHP